MRDKLKQIIKGVILATRENKLVWTQGLEGVLNTEIAIDGKKIPVHLQKWKETYVMVVGAWSGWARGYDPIRVFGEYMFGEDLK